MTDCTKCGQWLWAHGGKDHVCPPVFVCWDENDDEENGREIHAYDAERAAAEFVETTDPECDYRAVDSSVEVTVKAEDGTISQWEVFGERTVDYRAHEVTP